MFENTLKLESNVMRYIVKVGLKSMLGFRKRECDAIIDTGCKTTLCPLSIAKLFGTKRNISQNIHIGGRIYQSQIYVLNTIILDKLTIQHLPVFACDYRGSIRDSLLIGCNVLKQLKFLVDSSDNEFNFTQVFDKYNYYFDENNAYQEVLIEEEDEKENLT